MARRRHASGYDQPAIHFTQPIAQARRIAAAIALPAKLSALFLSDDVSLIADWARQLRAAIVPQPPNFCLRREWPSSNGRCPRASL